MRDLVVIVFFAIMLLLAFRKPFVGLSVWLWTAYISPSYITYGFASGFRYNFMAAIVTIFTFFISKEKNKFILNHLTILVILFFFWTSISSLLSIYESEVIYREWNKFFRVFILFVFSILIVRKKIHFIVICWAVVFSIGFYGFVEGLKFINSGGTHHIFGPVGTNIRDNNHLAAAINMMLPIAFFLYTQFKYKYMKLGFVFFITVSILCVVGTFSRGGFLGLVVLLFFTILQSKRKISTLIAFAIIIYAVSFFVPDEWTGRVDTIENVEQDSSFLGRLVAWKQSVLIAMDNPWTGGGFHAVQSFSVWQKYALDFDKLSFIPSPEASHYNFKAAHSIYFQVIGDQGFMGFFFYISILFFSYLAARRLAKRQYIPEQQWIGDLARMLALSILVFGVCGGLLSIAYLELTFLIVSLISILDYKIKTMG